MHTTVASTNTVVCILCRSKCSSSYCRPVHILYAYNESYYYSISTTRVCIQLEYGYYAYKYGYIMYDRSMYTYA